MVFWDEQPQCNGAGWSDDDHCNSQKDGWIYGGSQVNGFFGAGPNSPETGDYASTHQSVRQVKYTGTATSKLLLEAGYGIYLSQWGYTERPGNPTTNLIRAQEQTTQFFDANGNRVAAASPTASPSAATSSTARRTGPPATSGRTPGTASASYVTGSHTMKFGYQGAYHKDDDNLFDIITNSQRMTYRLGAGHQPAHGAAAGVRRGEPGDHPGGSVGPQGSHRVRGVLRAGPVHARPHDAAGRAALRPRLQQVPQQTIPKDVWWPNEFVMQETKGIDAYLDLSPRVGFAYDCLRHGKTSVKANLGRYLHPASNDGRYVFANPAQNIVTLAARPWTDSNGNWVVDCDLLNAAIQDNRGTGGDLCGQGDANYGKNRAATTMDPSILGGWKAPPLRLAVRRVGAAGAAAACLGRGRLLPPVVADVRRCWTSPTTSPWIRRSSGRFSVTASSAKLHRSCAGSSRRLLRTAAATRSAASTTSRPRPRPPASNVATPANNYGDYTRYWDGLRTPRSRRVWASRA
jgi:hypothetical protein